MDALTAYEQFLADQQIGTLEIQRFEADEQDIAAIHVAGVWRQRLVDHFNLPPEQTGDPLPWSKTHSLVRLREGELTVWHGPNGCGKSMVLGQVLLDLAIRHDRTSVIASLEMHPVSTLQRMCRQATEKVRPSPMDVDRFLGKLKSHVWLYDQVGTITPRRMFGVVRYSREELEADHIVIDSLMKCGIDSDDLNGQKRFVDRLSTYAKDTGAHIHLICHNRKVSGQNSADDQYSIKGASEISDMADNVIGCWRNKPKEAAKQKADGELPPEKAAEPDAVLNLEKQRHGEWEGRINLWFHQGCFQYLGSNTRDTMPYLGDAFGGEAW